MPSMCYHCQRQTRGIEFCHICKHMKIIPPKSIEEQIKEQHVWLKPMPAFNWCHEVIYEVEDRTFVVKDTLQGSFIREIGKK